ncbi:hypothetical protein AVM71_05410 [Piscirickettsia salmonis]|nr:hypothetical protein AVM71_05410 [Piscirickettsia salmonis]
MECADSRHVTLCDADSRGFIVVAFCSAILHHWMCKIPTEVATLTCSFISFIKLECARISDIISNWYQFKKDLFIGVVRDFIIKGIEAEEKSKLIPAVNA